MEPYTKEIAYIWGRGKEEQKNNSSVHQLLLSPKPHMHNDRMKVGNRKRKMNQVMTEEKTNQPKQTNKQNQKPQENIYI